MSTPLSFARDVQGYNTFSPPQSADKVSAAIPSGSSTSFVVPSNFVNWIANFSFQPGSDCWVAISPNTVTAAPPAGATFATSNSELLPGSRSVQAGWTISVYNNGTSTADVGISFYAVS